jgi:Cu(I)/Ag(I) efflux system membrane fusion protein
MNAWRRRISTLRTVATTMPGRRSCAASALILAAVAMVIAGCGRGPESPGASGPASPAAGNGAPEHALEHADPLYRCPMHPDVVSDEPGTCPVCGMDLVKVEQEPAATNDGAPAYYRHPHDPNRTSPVPKKDEMGMDYVAVYPDAVGPEVRISPAVVNNLGVRTAAVAREALALRAETVGYVSYDERRLQQVRPRAEGWIEGLSVRAVGETVRAGERLFTIYSPTLEAAQQEYLDALRIGNADLIQASRERLRALGLDAGTASRLARAGRASGRVPFHAPISGVVTGLEAREGAMLTPDMIAMTITELASLWVIAEVPESQAAWVRPGTDAELGFPSLPGETVRGRVEYVYPEISMDTRTVRARITLDQPPASIRPNMLATVVLVGERGEDALTIPRSALIRTGGGSRVVIALDGGRFVPRRVVAGAEVGERVVIRDGLAEGERVVVAGQFLLDSEANMRAGLARLGTGGAEPAGEAEDPGTADAGEPAPPEHRH